MKNLFEGFRLFVEDEEDEPDKFVSTAKKQLKVPKKLWLGMPVIISNTEIGNQKITQPTMFYITDLDDEEVTIKSVAAPGFGQDATDEDDDDPDDEINMDRDDVIGDQEFTISRDDFYKLVQPEMPPQQPGGMGGMM